jgi:protein-S-isoprenylcysteine O-methyltransferase Ste14
VIAQNMVTITDENVVAPRKREIVIRVSVTEWNFLRDKVNTMPERKAWFQNMAWAAVGGFLGTLLALVGWAQVFFGMASQTQIDNRFFWVVYVGLLLIFGLAAVVGFKVDEMTADGQAWSKKQVCADMDHIRDRHELNPTGQN